MTVLLDANKVLLALKTVLREEEESRHPDIFDELGLRDWAAFEDLRQEFRAFEMKHGVLQ